MDTISRENNSSYLPVAGVIAGVLAIVLAAVALTKISSLGKKVEAQEAQLARIDTIEGEVRNAVSTAEKANAGIATLQRSTQDAFTQVATELGNVRGEITKVQEMAKAAPAAKAAKTAGPVVAGDGEYIVKKGDYGTKIAKAHGTTLAALQAVNPGVSLANVKIGQKIKLPKK